MAMGLISVQASSVASESAFSTSERVLSIRRTRLTPASLEMCMRLKDHLDAKERKQDKCPLETPLDFKEDVFDDEVQRKEAIPLSDEEIALDANGSSEDTMSPGGPRYDYMMSRMSINIHKSHLLGIGISDVSVFEAANRIGCFVMKAPFRYLGIMVGGNMSLVKEWDESIAKLKKKLFKWKLKTLSIGGHLTLLKAVLGSTPIYNMSLFKVPKQDVAHLFFRCDMAKDVMFFVSRWWDLKDRRFGSFQELLAWFNSIRLGAKSKGVLE
nr:RNA-directed DNA polymerase, eukaryota, reverse transcriptase zinc-binding domain protein [Tanacetum cinerariifolium]